MLDTDFNAAADTTAQNAHAVAAVAAHDTDNAADTFSQHTATYSPEDNKLRLYPLHRLDDETYQRVKAAGFKWAPMQELFVAPMWTPERHDLLLELCGEIDAEDITLEERAAERAARFAGYHAARARDAQRARDAVSAITDHIPLGQPILVGHHSERRARRDAERIENGIRRAVSLWDTAEHWKRRAVGAQRNAAHKGSADVRHRRIKGLEADLRKQEKIVNDAEQVLQMWRHEDMPKNVALRIAEYAFISQCFPLDKYPRDLPKSQYEGELSLWSALNDDIITVAQAKEIAVSVLQGRAEWHRRWRDHYANRIVYERAMLGEQGGIAADKFDIQVGGQVLVRGDWVTVKRVNRKDGKIMSVSTNARYVPVRPIEEVTEYRAPTAEQAAAAKSVTKLPPMCNYPEDGFLHLTKAEWDATHKDYKGSRELGSGSMRAGGYRPDLKDTDAAEKFGRHRVRVIVRGGGLKPVYLTDAKRVDPPAPTTEGAQPAPQLPPPERDISTPHPVYRPREENEFDAMREQLRSGGVQVVSAPQLFPTPAALAARMVELSGLVKGMTMLEPSAGTGAILAAVRKASGGGVTRTAVEISVPLCGQLRIREAGAEIFNRNFLDCTPDELGRFDCVLMNPPFANEQDIKHILHAVQFLKPGGVLVAICAGGPSRSEKLRPMIEANGGLWEPLPSGTFESSGTMVSSVLMTYANQL